MPFRLVFMIRPVKYAQNRPFLEKYKNVYVRELGLKIFSSASSVLSREAFLKNVIETASRANNQQSMRPTNRNAVRKEDNASNGSIGGSNGKAMLNYIQDEQNAQFIDEDERDTITSDKSYRVNNELVYFRNHAVQRLVEKFGKFEGHETVPSLKDNDSGLKCTLPTALHTLNDVSNLFTLLLCKQQQGRQQFFDAAVNNNDDSLSSDLKTLVNHSLNLDEISASDLMKIAWIYEFLNLDLNIANVKIFIAPIVHGLLERLNTLNGIELLSLFYFTLLTRKFPANFSESLQNAVIKRQREFSVDDFALISLAFFKCRILITNQRIFEIFVESLSNANFSALNTYTLVALLKILTSVRNFVPIYYIGKVSSIFGSLSQTDFEKFPFIVYGRFVRWAIVCNYFDPIFADKLKSYLLSIPLESLRFKETGNFFHYYAKLDVVPEREPEVQRLLKHLHRLMNFTGEFHRYYPTVLFHCICRNLYFDDIISQVLSDAFIRQLVKDYKTTGEFACLNLVGIDSSLAIERPNYWGNRLTQDLYTVIAKYEEQKLDSPHGVSARQYTLTNISNTLCQLLDCRRNCCYVGPILPHFKHHSNILMKFRNGKPVENIGLSIDLTLKPRKHGDFLVPDDEVWLAFIPKGKDCNIRNTQFLNGFFACQRRQLLSLGYKVIEVTDRLHGMHFGKKNKEATRSILHSLINNPDLKSFDFTW